ncbi:hypothetical protein FACS1894109_07090 [Spirochaetia bacterium]|nr:hypothetical protein FACS1894109_07090 [Spirochaetia bacterium]
MKRFAIASLFLVLVLPGARSALAVSAQEAASFTVPAKETSRSTGFEFGNTIEHGGNADNSYFGSPGMSFEHYSFRDDKNFGRFSHGSFTVPVIGDDTYDFQWGFLSGPAFRVRFTDRLTLHTGLGFGASGLFAWYDEADADYFKSAFNFGVGADAGLKIDITDTFFIKGGVNVTWSFLGITNVRENDRSHGGRGETNKNPWGHWTLNANPYISFGVNLYSPKRQIQWPVYERPQYGKPPREEAAQ